MSKIKKVLKVTGAVILVKLNNGAVYQVTTSAEEIIYILHMIKDDFNNDGKLPILDKPYNDIDLIDNLTQAETKPKTNCGYKISDNLKF